MALSALLDLLIETLKPKDDYIQTPQKTKSCKCHVISMSLMLFLTTSFCPWGSTDATRAWLSREGDLGGV